MSGTIVGLFGFVLSRQFVSFVGDFSDGDLLPTFFHLFVGFFASLAVLPSTYIIVPDLIDDKVSFMLCNAPRTDTSSPFSVDSQLHIGDRIVWPMGTDVGSEPLPAGAT